MAITKLRHMAELTRDSGYRSTQSDGGFTIYSPTLPPRKIDQLGFLLQCYGIAPTFSALVEGLKAANPYPERIHKGTVLYDLAWIVERLRRRLIRQGMSVDDLPEWSAILPGKPDFLPMSPNVMREIAQRICEAELGVAQSKAASESREDIVTQREAQKRQIADREAVRWHKRYCDDRDTAELLDRIEREITDDRQAAVAKYGNLLVEIGDLPRQTKCQRCKRRFDWTGKRLCNDCLRLS